jgi:hypothetical protein
VSGDSYAKEASALSSVDSTMAGIQNRFGQHPDLVFVRLLFPSVTFGESIHTRRKDKSNQQLIEVGEIINTRRQDKSNR